MADDRGKGGGLAPTPLPDAQPCCAFRLVAVHPGGDGIHTMGLQPGMPSGVPQRLALGDRQDAGGAFAHIRLGRMVTQTL